MMQMGSLALKACSRCGGDVEYASDKFGPYRQCLFCARLEDLDEHGQPLTPPEPIKQAPKRKNKWYRRKELRLAQTAS